MGKYYKNIIGILKTFHETNSSILISIKVIFNLCNLQFVNLLLSCGSVTPIIKRKLISFFFKISH